MKPSQLASQLRRIASKIDASKNPDRTLVAKDLKKVLSSLKTGTSSIVYRIITDEPQGICVGFKPSQSALDSIRAETDEWNLVSDDGSHGTPFLTGNGNDIAIIDVEIDDQSIPEGYIPLGMDMYVWRSEKEMLEWGMELV